MLELSDKFGWGVATIGVAAAQITSATTPLISGILLVADPNNSGRIAVGGAGVTLDTVAATDGMELNAGDAMAIPVSDASLLYAIASAASQRLAFFYI